MFRQGLPFELICVYVRLVGGLVWLVSHHVMVVCS